MSVSLAALALITLLVFVKATIDIETANRRISQLQNMAAIHPAGAPGVSVIIPACNEESSIEAALSSVLTQDYSHLEVIVVNDRSFDRTGAILDGKAPSCSRMRVVHVAELPPNWLGKNNALRLGAAMARGEWLLFADADVVMHASAIAPAIRYVIDRNLDHLAVAPRAVVGGFLAKAFLGTFALLFMMSTKPWKVRDRKAKEYIGIGAFNLVRAEARGARTRAALRRH
jgi:cellulose synthase/poly-beta-1,6-N-acetylglucosamine synthase-like glycosyltransferase